MAQCSVAFIYSLTQDVWYFIWAYSDDISMNQMTMLISKLDLLKTKPFSIILLTSYLLAMNSSSSFPTLETMLQKLTRFARG